MSRGCCHLTFSTTASKTEYGLSSPDTDDLQSSPGPLCAPTCPPTSTARVTSSQHTVLSSPCPANIALTRDNAARLLGNTGHQPHGAHSCYFLPTLPRFTSGKESDFALLKMSLDNLLNTHAHLTKQFKYQVLLDHLKLPSGYKLPKAFMHDPRPYTSALQALQDKYGQPRQLVQSELGAIG